MQDTKHIAFLMHPTHTTNATEGSRLALGHEGGCIKKAPAETGASRRNGEENLGCHGSGRLGGLGFAGGLAENCPIHIGSEFFAADISRGQGLDLWAALSRYRAVALGPLVDGRRLNPHRASQARLTAKLFCGPENCIRHSLIMRPGLISVNRNCLTCAA